MINTKKQFIDRVNVLLGRCIEDNEDCNGNEVEGLEINSIMSVLEQNIGNYEYSEFMNYIHNNHYQLKYEHVYQLSVGTLEINIFNVLNNKMVTYTIHFNRILENSENYCECNPGDEDYNEAYGCCGINCTWEIPTMTVYKEDIVISTSEFKGTAKDLWKCEDRYPHIEVKLNNEVTHKSELLESEIDDLEF